MAIDGEADEPPRVAAWRDAYVAGRDLHVRRHSHR
jgi:hypothetical protein